MGGITEAGVGKCPAMSTCFKPDLDKNEELLRVRFLPPHLDDLGAGKEVPL